MQLEVATVLLATLSLFVGGGSDPPAIGLVFNAYASLPAKAEAATEDCFQKVWDRSEGLIACLYERLRQSFSCPFSEREAVRFTPFLVIRCPPPQWGE
jgi:hypothetical protein